MICDICSALLCYYDLTHLADETEGHPLVVGVVHQVLALSLPGTATLEASRYVEGAVHPAVSLECCLTDSAPREVALYGLAKELVAGDRDGAEDEESAGPAIEQSEGPVVNGGLPLSYLDNNPA